MEVEELMISSLEEIHRIPRPQVEQAVRRFLSNVPEVPQKELEEVFGERALELGGRAWLAMAIVPVRGRLEPVMREALGDNLFEECCRTMDEIGPISLSMMTLCQWAFLFCLNDSI